MNNTSPPENTQLSSLRLNLALISLTLTLLSATFACRDAGSVQIALPSPTQPSEIVVYVTGEILDPGLHRLPPGEHRLMDAIKAAGGFTENADRASVNGALIISDQQHINVLAMPVDAGASPVNAQSGGTSGGLINLNSASSEELETLPGIGPGRAEAIVEHRTANGPFARIEDILQVTGIGEKTFESIKDLIVVR